jgi:hypothetical protein
MDEWIDEYAGALGEQPLSPAETADILKLARDVAHGVERRLAPLAAFVAGLSAARTSAGAGDRAAAVRAALDRARTLIPASAEEEPS